MIGLNKATVVQAKLAAWVGLLDFQAQNLPPRRSADAEVLQGFVNDALKLNLFKPTAKRDLAVLVKRLHQEHPTVGKLLRANPEETRSLAGELHWSIGNGMADEDTPAMLSELTLLRDVRDFGHRLKDGLKRPNGETIYSERQNGISAKMDELTGKPKPKLRLLDDGYDAWRGKEGDWLD